MQKEGGVRARKAKKNSLAITAANVGLNGRSQTIHWAPDGFYSEKEITSLKGKKK